eukprot:6208219-Pleurochrysis_carterae.AAC.2
MAKPLAIVAGSTTQSAARAYCGPPPLRRRCKQPRRPAECACSPCACARGCQPAYGTLSPGKASTSVRAGTSFGTAYSSKFLRPEALCARYCPTAIELARHGVCVSRARMSPAPARRPKINLRPAIAVALSGSQWMKGSRWVGS